MTIDRADGTRFGELWRRCVASPPSPGAASVFADLRARLLEPGRRFHNMGHIDDCLARLDEVERHVEDPDAVELALWFHDAVYVPAAADNEESSARLLIQESRRLRIDAATAERSATLVRATAHPTAEALAPEAALMLDVDLSILGSDPVRFLEYEYAIGEEFQDTPRLKFEIGRGRFLTSLLARPSIFHTDFFRERYEAVAREQLSALLRTPRYRTFRLTRWLTRPLHGERAVA